MKYIIFLFYIFILFMNSVGFILVQKDNCYLIEYCYCALWLSLVKQHHPAIGAIWHCQSKLFLMWNRKHYRATGFISNSRQCWWLFPEKGTPRTKPSAQHLWLITELAQKYISSWALVSRVEWNGSIVSLMCLHTAEKIDLLSPSQEAQAHIHIWISALRITLPTKE